MKSCLICDDHALIREALSATIKGRWPVAHVAEAPDFDKAKILAKAQPDICLVDLVMPGDSPVEGVRSILDAAPQSYVVVVTGSANDRLMLDLLDIGVHGFLEKTSTSEVILAALDLVLAGGRYLPPAVAELALERNPADNGGPRLPNFTDRQIEVLSLIADGQSNKEIARVLDLSPSTVKTHVANIIAAIGASNRTEAAFQAKVMGLI